jgi:hypothetical protein
MKVGDLLIFHTIESFRSDLMLNYDYNDDEQFIKLYDKIFCVLMIENIEHPYSIDSCVCFVPSKNKNIILPKKQLTHV